MNLPAKHRNQDHGFHWGRDSTLAVMADLVLKNRFDGEDFNQNVAKWGGMKWTAISPVDKKPRLCRFLPLLDELYKLDYLMSLKQLVCNVFMQN